MDDGNRPDRPIAEAKPEFSFYIDVFSYCNLRCPSCIVGNEFGDKAEWPRGLMDVETLRRILDKATSECLVTSVGVFNWTEPLLNPQLPDLVREIRRRGISCRVSSNLNVREDYDFEALLEAAPNLLRVSTSGFTQSIYERGHAGGDVERVKRNLRRVAEIRRRRSRKTTRFIVFYHIYNDNQHEIEPMKAFVEDLGFTFSTTHAQIFPVEKIIDIREGRVSQSDRKVLDRLSLPLGEALDITSKEPAESCVLMDRQMVLDVSGNVMLCCGASMNRVNALGRYLDLSVEEIQARKNAHGLCGTCLKVNVPRYFFGSPELEDLAARSVPRKPEIARTAP